MFEFAIAQHQKRIPTRRRVVALIASCMVHLAALAILILNPEILRPGKGHWLSHLELLHLFKTTPKPVEGGWRTVAVVGSGGPMRGLSAESLRAYAYDWRKGSGNSTAPAVSIKLDKEIAGEGKSATRVEPLRPALGTPDPKPAAASTAAAKPQEGPAQGDVGARPTESAGAPVQVAASGGGGAARGTAPFLPAPSPAPATPKQIPNKVVAPVEVPKGPPVETAASAESQGGKKALEQAPVEPKIFSDQQSAIRSQESGFFDTKGFPLGEYARIVVERIKGNWSIPSNLRNSQGRSSVIFYIDKTGRVSEIRVVSSSGIQSLDLAALSSVFGSSPFPPLPQGFPGERVGAKFVFAYNERH
jgi:protein TonB